MGTRTVSPHDEFFKEIFGEPAHARDLLEGILPPEVRDLLDLEHLQREDCRRTLQSDPSVDT